jgi:hypothetical protein
LLGITEQRTIGRINRIAEIEIVKVERIVEVKKTERKAGRIEVI